MNVSVALTSDTAYAGLFGYVEGATITDVHLTDVTVTATTAATSIGGGLVGYAKGTTIITNCYATVKVDSSSPTKQDAYAYAGGLVGEDSGTIKNCYATGEVTASSSGSVPYAGGLVGKASGTIKNSIALNQWVNASGGTNIGRVVGSGTVTLNYNYAWEGMQTNGNWNNNDGSALSYALWNNSGFFIHARL